MEVSQELLKAMVNGFDNVKSVDVNYENGETVSGFIKYLNLNPSLDVTLCKHRTPRNVSPYHYLDFSRAVKITLLYNDGETRVFE